MARPRTPTKVLDLRGAFKKHPERRAEREGEPEVTGPLGEPPAYLDAEEVQCWHDAAAELPWLGDADRMMLAAFVKQWAVLRRKGGKAGEWAVLRGFLSELGGGAASRSKLKVPDGRQKPANPFDEVETA